MRTFEKDYAFGISNENKVLDAVKVFDPTLKKSGQYDPFDFVGTSCYVELKTRNNKKDKYPTTMISQSKIEYAKRNPELEFVFCFQFEDGLYYIKYDEKVFAEFEVCNGGRFDRGRPELNLYCYIPVSLLKLVTF